MARKNEVVEKQENALVVVDFGSDAGAGFDGVDSSHLKIPFLKLAQSTNDEVKPKNPKYIQGLEPGMFFNSVTKEIYPNGIEFIPAHLDHSFLEWVPRKRGGGFAGRHDLNSPTVQKAKSEATGRVLVVQRKEEDGTTVINELQETFTIAGVLVLDGGQRLEPIIISATSTKITPYREWMTRVNMFTINVNGRKQRPPLFAHRVIVSARDAANAKGDFKNIVIQPAIENNVAKSLITEPTGELFQTAKAVRTMIASGEAEAAYESVTADEVESDKSDNF